MKQHIFIIAVILVVAVFFGCASKDMRSHELIDSDNKPEHIDAIIRKGDDYARAGKIKKACYNWKCACKMGDCSNYASLCLNDSSADAKEYIDQDLLAEIVLKDKNPDIRAAAARNLTDQGLLARIAVKDDDEYVRSIAGEKLTDQTLLARIAIEDRHELVRRTAAEKLTDQTSLARIALEDSDMIVRMIAAPKITDQTLLARIAVESKDTSIRESAVKKLTSQALLAKIAAEDDDITIRCIAANRLTDFVKAEWDNESSEKLNSDDFLNMITDSTGDKGAVWDKGVFKNEAGGKTDTVITEAAAGKSYKKNDFDKNNMAAAALCGNDYCEKNENHADCPGDCFPKDVKPNNLSEDDRAVFLNFVYKGQKSGIYFVVNRGIHEKLASFPRMLSYKKEKEEIKKDFILPRIDNQLQRKKLLPLVKKIKSLTPDVNKQARIAISLVQNIPYGFTPIGDSEINYEKKYPYGVIWEHTGICDEKSDLLIFLLRELGFGTAALIYKKEYHRAVGIKCPDAYDVGDSGYCYVETTSPKIITDNSPNYMGVGTLTDFTVVNISDGIQLEGVDEEFADKILYYDLILKAKAKNGTMQQDEYTRYNSILSKYGMK